MKPYARKAGAAAALVLGLAGCVVPPPGGYPSAGYSPGNAYPSPPPGYPPPQTSYVPQPPDYTADQYVYTDGTPYAVVGGQQYVVLFDPGLGWGYYDGYRRWHGAPPRWRDDFDRRYPGGRGYTPSGPRESNFRPGGPLPGYAPGRPPEPSGFARPQGPPPGRAPEPPGFARPQAPPPGRPPEPAGFARPQAPPPGRPAEPAGFSRPQGPPPGRPAEPAAAARPQGPPPHEAARPACGAPGAPHC